MEHIRVVEDVKRFYALGYDMNSEADLRALNDAYALLTEEFGAGRQVCVEAGRYGEAAASGLSKSDIDNLRVYYMIWKTSRPRRS